MLDKLKICDIITVMIIVFREVTYVKYSKQREALLTLLKSTHSHPTADWLYQELKKNFPNISLGMVYRNLGVLSENGDITALNIKSDKEHFDGFTHEHYHFVCNKCGFVSDINLPVPSDWDESIEQQIGAQVDRHSLVFYGTCSKCR